MKESGSIQKAMFLEMQEKSIFAQAQLYGFEYLDSVFERNVFPTNEALDNLKHFDEPMPEEPANASEVIDMLHQYGAPATVAIVGGRYFGFVNGSVVPAGMAAKTLATFWDQNTAMQVLSPIAAKLEMVAEKWLAELFNLPGNTVAGFVSGTSAANLCALAAARYRVFKKIGWDINEQGLFNAPKIRIVAGRQAHSTVIKAIALLGFGKENIEWADTDEQGRIIPASIPPLDSKTILILQAGNVNSGSFDPFTEICARANKAGAWVHIDGAFGLWAAATKELKHLTNGMELANSWAVDGHKTLNTPYDSGIVLCNDADALTAALHMTGSYIVIGQERDGMFYTPEMSRRARIIELWATLKYLGKEGINEMVFEMHQRAVQFAGALRKIDGFTVLNDIVFNQVMVRCNTDELTEKTMKRVQELRECWVGGALWQGKKIIRISVCSWATTVEDINRSATSFEQALNDVMHQ
jgi:glutamate/tyrosine decarboxylase-like PLP-dependent enzyme